MVSQLLQSVEQLRRGDADPIRAHWTEAETIRHPEERERAERGDRELWDVATKIRLDLRRVSMSRDPMPDLRAEQGEPQKGDERKLGRCSEAHREPQATRPLHRRALTPTRVRIQT